MKRWVRELVGSCWRGCEVVMGLYEEVRTHLHDDEENAEPIR